MDGYVRRGPGESRPFPACSTRLTLVSRQLPEANLKASFRQEHRLIWNPEHGDVLTFSRHLLIACNTNTIRTF